MDINANGTPRAVSREKLELSDQITDCTLGRMETIARQLETQHQRLDPFFARVGTALAQGRSREAQTAAFQLQGVLDVHFLFEEKTLFPAVRSVFPETGDELDALCAEHKQARAGIQRAIDDILESQLETARDAFTGCALFISRHERREVALVSEAVRSANSWRNNGAVDPETDSTKR